MASTNITTYLGEGTLSARPASPSLPPGGLAFYYATDGAGTLYQYPQSVGAWSAVGGSSSPLFIVPKIANFSAVNVSASGAAASDQTGFLQFTQPALGGNRNLAQLYETAGYPASSFTRWLGLSLSLVQANYYQGGLVVGDGTGKLVTFSLTWNSGAQYEVANYNSQTSYNAAVTSPNATVFPPYIGLQDDGTNFSLLASYDGAASQVVYSVSKTSFIGAPTELGFYINAYSVPLTAKAFHYAPTLPFTGR